MAERDAIEIMVSSQASVLIRFGKSEADARREAESIVAGILDEMASLGVRDVYLGVALRRSRVYRMRCGGLKFGVVCERLGITRQQAAKDYRAELMRRRTA